MTLQVCVSIHLGHTPRARCTQPASRCVITDQYKCTTTYHPIANGQAERFHRQLKTALRAQSNNTSWADHLPLVLLGIGTALKEDLKCTTAELVYGTTLRLPAEFFNSSSSSDELDPGNYVTQFRTTMQQLQAMLPHYHTKHKSYVCKDFAHCTHVFVRHNALRGPLQQPYDGPHKVVQCDAKTITLEVNRQQKVVSLDQLKPGYVENPSIINTTPIDDCSRLDSPSFSSPTPTATTTWSERHIRWPVHFGR